jgi:hypothetical protein
MMDVLKEKEPTISFKRKGSSLGRSKHPADSASMGTTQR